jgi:DNA processing protein
VNFASLSDVEALAMLAEIPLLGSIKIRLLVGYFGSPQEALAASAEQIAALPGFGQKVVANWQRCRSELGWKKNLEIAGQHQASLIAYTDPRFPKRLLEITDHPVLLYIKGELKPSDQYSLAIVGTRQPTIYGQEIAAQLSEQLAGMGFTIVSGLARGIDTIAHKGALVRGRSIAVIGSGLANIYPKENSVLAKSISTRGALISEFSMTTPPDRQNFPQRNRIVSGMTMGTILIEAPVESGAMITMERACRQKRKTFAIPGRIDSDSFRGNHRLIKEGLALLVENAEDIACHFNTFFGISGGLKPVKNELEIELDREEETLRRLLPNEEITFDGIFHLAKMPASKLNVLLMSLVLKKAIKEFPGKIFKKISPL